jgi:hypothetical protein
MGKPGHNVTFIDEMVLITREGIDIHCIMIMLLDPIEKIRPGNFDNGDSRTIITPIDFVLNETLKTMVVSELLKIPNLSQPRHFSAKGPLTLVQGCATCLGTSGT